MNALATAEGRTVVFVSHNTKAVLDLCGEAIWLERGRVAARGAPRDVLARYLGEGASRGEWRGRRVRRRGLRLSRASRSQAERRRRRNMTSRCVVELEYEMRRVSAAEPAFDSDRRMPKVEVVLCSSDTDEASGARRAPCRLAGFRRSDRVCRECCWRPAIIR